ncbi:hypothetical protein VRP85_011365 (plasmid) [Campylobacter jejuni]
MKLEDIFVYMVLMIVSFIAGLVGIVTKNKLSKALNLKGEIYTLFKRYARFYVCSISSFLKL